MVFRAGTGNPPLAPETGYATNRTLDLLSDCGWLFVRTRDAGTVPVLIGSYGVDQPIEEWALSHSGLCGVAQR